MPTEDDGITDLPIAEPEDNEMADAMTIDAGILSQMGARLLQAGNHAHENFITISKAQDYDYMENKRMVTLDEAIGAREVASKVTPGGPSPAQ